MSSVLMRDLLRNVTAMLTSVRLIVLHIVLNVAILAAAAAWLLIPEGHVWQLIAAVLSALTILFVFLWLHSGTLAYALDPEGANFWLSFSLKPYRIVWALLGAFILFFCMYIVAGWTDDSINSMGLSSGVQYKLGGYLYSKAPSFLRPNSGPQSYDTTVGFAFSILFWYLLPSLFLPLITARVSGGTVLCGLRALKRWQYWLAVAMAAFVGVWIPVQIFDWIPGKTLEAQTTGLVIRLLLVYLLATAAWLAATGIVGYFVHIESANEPVPRQSFWGRLFHRGGAAPIALH